MWYERFLNPRFIKKGAKFLQVCCWLMLIGFFCVGILVIAGRGAFELHTREGVLPRAIYGSSDYQVSDGQLTVSLPDRIYVRANEQGKVDGRTQAGIILLFVLHLLPAALSYWILARIFGTVAGGEIFSERNARGLMWFGLIKLGSGLILPWLKLGLSGIINLCTTSPISLSVQAGLTGIMPGFAVLAAAYIIHYGIELQNGTDRSL